MLSQLDRLEAEHNHRNATIERSVIENDATSLALGLQLAEAQYLRSQLETENEKIVRNLMAAEEDAQ